jgi:hypothetical protein
MRDFLAFYFVILGCSFSTYFSSLLFGMNFSLLFEPSLPLQPAFVRISLALQSLLLMCDSPVFLFLLVFKLFLCPSSLLSSLVLLCFLDSSRAIELWPSILLTTQIQLLSILSLLFFKCGQFYQLFVKALIYFMLYSKL